MDIKKVINLHIAWQAMNSENESIFWTKVDNETIFLRLNDFPEEPICTLIWEDGMKDLEEFGKKWLLPPNPRAEAEREKRSIEIQNAIKPHNDKCDLLMKRIAEEGLICQHCKTESGNYRIAKCNGRKSLVICLACGWPVKIEAR